MTIVDNYDNVNQFTVSVFLSCKFEAEKIRASPMVLLVINHLCCVGFMRSRKYQNKWAIICKDEEGKFKRAKCRG